MAGGLPLVAGVKSVQANKTRRGCPLLDAEHMLNHLCLAYAQRQEADNPASFRGPRVFDPPPPDPSVKQTSLDVPRSAGKA